MLTKASHPDGLISRSNSEQENYPLNSPLFPIDLSKNLEDDFSEIRWQINEWASCLGIEKLDI